VGEGAHGQTEGAGQTEIGELQRKKTNKNSEAEQISTTSAGSNICSAATPRMHFACHCIANLERSLSIDEQILRLEIAVQHAVRVAEGDSLDQLLHVALHQQTLKLLVHLHKQTTTMQSRKKQ